MNLKKENREIKRIKFLQINGYGSWSIQAFTADASFRRYFRLKQGKESVLLMDAPPPHENIERFQLVAKHLNDCGIRAPHTYAFDSSNGFLIVEDFGDDTFTRMLDNGENPERLYTMAVDTLVRLHKNKKATNIAIEPFDLNVFIAEAELFIDWYYPAVVGRQATDLVRESYYDAWNSVWNELPPVKNPTIALCDYHVDNVMRIGNGFNVENCALLDFQDAVIGAQCIDLMSLLEDARRDVSGKLIVELITRYKLAMADRIDPGFDRWYAVTAAHRHMRVMGVFVRLCKRDHKDVYLCHLPRVARLLESHRNHTILSPIYNWLEKHLPNLVESAQSLSQSNK